MNHLFFNSMIWLSTFFVFIIIDADKDYTMTAIVISSIYNVGFLITKELNKHEDNTDNE